MADQNVIVGQDTVVVSGGQPIVTVDANFGLKGDNGSIILYGHGKPQNIAKFPRTPQILDWYINIDSTDDEYLYIYQYIYTNNVGNWTRVFKIIPNAYQTNRIVDFDENGIAVVNIEVSNTTLPLIPQQQFPSTGSVILQAADEEEMLALSSATPGVYAFRQDLAKYYFLRESPSSVASNWEGLITVNAHVDIENQLPVISSFQVGRPTVGTDPVTGIDSYVLPITLVAYQLTQPLPTPITGSRTAHISINVI